MDIFGGGKQPSSVGRNLIIGVFLFSLGYSARSFLAPRSQKSSITKAPRTLLQSLSEGEISALPYPPNVLPGAREVDTPYGSIHVNEWGPESGEKILLLTGIGTPSLALGDMGEEFSKRGYRVMMFDFFGRGWSDNPDGVAHDNRLYAVQILLVLASSPLSWTGCESFHLLGYSLGGGLAVSFARYFPHVIRSLTLVAPSGLIRRNHVNWKGKLLYSRGVLPEWLLVGLVKRRLQPNPRTATAATGSEDTSRSITTTPQRQYNSDANGGDNFNDAILSTHRPSVTVADVVSWQLAHHPAFVPAFMSSIREAPIYEQQQAWSVLGRHMAARRSNQNLSPTSQQCGKVLLILGAADPVIVKDELVLDARSVLGDDGLEVVVLDGGHEIAITKGVQIAATAVKFWKNQC